MDDLFEIFANTADGAFIIDEEQQIIFWNQAAQEILGYTSDEIIGQPCYKILRGCDDKGHIVCHHDCNVSLSARTGDTVTNYDLVTCTKSGEMRWINVSILNLPSEDDSKSVVVHLFRDATKTKQNEQFVYQMFDAVERWQKITTPTTPVAAAEAPPTELTNREREVLALLAQGFNTADIARSLSITSATVRNHVQSILHKLQVHSRLEAVTYAFNHKLATRD
jgi:PAS domain S-box-containing protein